MRISLAGPLIIISVTTGLHAASPPASGPLRVHPQNPRYFADAEGKPVYLTGSHVWNNLQDVTGEAWFLPNLISRHGYDVYLDFLVSKNHNFIRLWIIEHAWDEKEKSRITPHPWMRTGPGNAFDGLPRFDLNRPDQAFYDHLRQRVIAARDRGIYISVMLFGGMWGTEHPSTWKGHPFNRENNVNKIDGDADRYGLGNDIYTLKVPALVAIQKAHVRKTIDTLNDLDNVLFEIANEVREYSTAWQYEMIKAVKDHEATKPKRHPVGMTGYDTIPDRDLFESPADWVSPSNSGGDYKGSPPPATGRKVIAIDTDHLWGEGGNPAWVWKSFTRGLNPIWMERIKMGDGDLPHADAIRAAMGQTRSFAQRMDLASMTPHGDLASTGYCLAHPGKEYLVYLPDGGEVTVDLSATSGLLAAEWFDTHAGKTVGRTTVQGGGTRKLRAPFEGDAALHIRSGRPLGWWSAKGLRIATYEFLEEMKGGAELSVEEILEQIRRLGGVDVLLCKGFQYYRGVFDESTGGLPRYRTKIRQLIPLAHREDIRVGVFGFTDRRRCYQGQPDHAKVLGAWQEYADMGTDLFFVDEESGKDGLDIPVECVAYCDELRSRFRLPVGIFFYGDASSGARLVKMLAGHVDMIGEMSYSLYLDKPGEYGLARVTKECSDAARSVDAGVAYWSGAGIFGEKEFPGLPGTAIWRERYGDRDEAGYFHDYLKAAIENGATGVYYHSLCRTTWWAEDRRARILAGIRKVFGELERERRETSGRARGEGHGS